MHTVVMPKLGDTMEEGKILTWLKKEGDTVQKGDALAEIETEKVNIEVEAFAAGILRKILAPAGATIPVGDPIALTGTADEPLPATATAQAAATATQTASTAGAGNPATLTEQSAQANVAPEQVRPAVAQPQPVSTAVMAGTNGYTAAAPTQTNAHVGRIFISPIARRIAAEHDLDISAIAGTGPGGRIQREDVEAALAHQQQVGIPAQPVASAATVVAGQTVAAVPLSAMRKTIAKRLQQSMQTAPHFYVTMAIDTTKLGSFRETINEYAATQPQPVKVSVNDLVVKAAATALEQMPAVNVSFDGEQLLYKRQINVGVAVALDQGLIVPVVRDANKRGVLDVARETRRLADAARAGKLKPEEFQGGTFSVSNLGMYGVDEFTAIINPPESCILAVGAIVPTPVVQDGQVVVRDIMKVTLSVDHRALDGATAARFLQELRRLLEQPLGMLL